MYKDKKVIHIVCTGKNGEIGYDNKLLFNLPPDMKFFREQTLGHTVLMGRKTVESLPKILDRRVILKVTSRKNYYDFAPNFEMDVFDYFDEAKHVCDNFLNTDKIFVGGGSQLYHSTFDITDELWITEVANDVVSCDTWYKIPKEDFTMFEHTNWMEHTNPLGETLTYRFTKWIRKQVIPF